MRMQEAQTFLTLSLLHSRLILAGLLPAVSTGECAWEQGTGCLLHLLRFGAMALALTNFLNI